MSYRRILIYSETQTAAATMQIRLVGPLSQRGFELVDAHEFLHSSNQPLQKLAQSFDAVVVHRGIRKRCPLYPLLISAAREQQVPVILDIDDLLFRVPRSHPDFAVYQSRTAQALKVLLDADTVVASTPPLAENLAAFHSSVVVIPNELPSSLWGEICRQKQAECSRSTADRITIGYIGSGTHRPDLQSIEEVLLTVLRRHRNRVRFLSVGVPLSPRLSREPNVEQIKPSKRIAHSYSEFVQFAASLPIEIGIAPLLDNLFNCCKSNAKFQEYAALGIAGVYSDLPTYHVGVRHGENGFVAKTPAQWEWSLEQLVTASDLRIQLAQTAALDLQTNWRLAKAGELWNETLALAKTRAQQRTASSAHSIAAIVDDLIEYQAGLERQLKKSVRYQASKIISRLMRKWAA